MTDITHGKYIILNPHDAFLTVAGAIDDFRQRHPYTPGEFTVFELKPVKRVELTVTQKATVEDIS